MSLPLVMGTRLETIPPPVACATPAVPVLAPGLRHAALVVSGAAGNAADAARSIPAPLFAPLLAVPGWHFHIVQTEWRPADAAFLRARPNVTDHGARLGDFADTAALLAAMEVVIGVDTSVVHLAGMQARACWVLLPLNADWRWLRDRADSPWYPRARLFRQVRRGDWPAVIARVATALRACHRRTEAPDRL